MDRSNASKPLHGWHYHHLLSRAAGEATASYNAPLEEVRTQTIGYKPARFRTACAATSRRRLAYFHTDRVTHNRQRPLARIFDIGELSRLRWIKLAQRFG